MSGLDTVAALRHLGRKDLVVGVTGKPASWMTLPKVTSSEGNALLSDQQEYLDKGADRLVLGSYGLQKAVNLPCCSVLTKPVMENSLLEMLDLAREHKQNIADTDAS